MGAILRGCNPTNKKKYKDNIDNIWNAKDFMSYDIL